MDIEKLFLAYYACRKNKRNTKSVITFELDYESELFRLADDIENHTYKISPATAFIVNYPVKREIFAGAFRDRVIHHYLIGELELYFERLFIYDSYACRQGKGTLFGIRRAERFIRQCSHGYTRDAYILQLDIAGFFMSIDRSILLSRLSSFVHEKFGEGGTMNEMIYLITEILTHNPVDTCIIRGAREDWVGLPHNKSLFFSPRGRGLPIGNLTSQVFANFYMHTLDVFIKKELGIKYYGRYVDDILLVHHDSEFLLSCIPHIEGFLSSELGLTLHPKKIRINHIRDGFLFLGAYIKPYRSYIGNRTKNQWYHCIQKLSNTSDEKVLSQMNSYLGLVSHFSTFALRKKILGHFTKSNFSFSIGNMYRLVKKCRIT